MHPLMKGGFTLIELLIVIAVVGIMAAILLVALNPTQQFAKSRDSNRYTTVSQLGRAVQAALVTDSGGNYINAGLLDRDGDGNSERWLDELLRLGELSSIPQEVGNSLTAICGYSVNYNQNGYCYYATLTFTDPTWAIVSSRLEAEANISKCPSSFSGPRAYAAWTSDTNKVGTVCTDNVEPLRTNFTWVN